MKTIIPYVNIIKQSKKEENEIFKSIKKVLFKSDFILGKEVEIFEKKIQKFLKVKHCIALNSGTDALTLGLFLIGVRKNDEVITPPNSFIASTAAIVHLGAKPIFVDILDDQNLDPKKIEDKISKKTKAIMPVHLTGKPCQMTRIMSISNKYKIPVIEDAAQAIGSKYNGKNIGTFGVCGCFSAHPLKNLNAIGDSGYLVTNNTQLAKKARILRNHGIYNRDSVKNFGFVSRMDTIQASVLNYRLRKLKSVIKKRRKNANLYRKLLKDVKNVYTPNDTLKDFSTYHTYVIRAKKRDLLKKYLKKKGVQTSIHYPKLIFEQIAFKNRFKDFDDKDLINAKKINKEIITLPINQFLTSNHIKSICKIIRDFYL